MSEVLVFGASGFVGGAVMRALARTPGLTPVACLRRPPARPPAWPYRLCDATDAVAVASVAQGAAGAVNAVLGDAATMLRATRSICAAARAAGLRRVIHVSTASVYGHAEGRVAEEAALVRPVAGIGAYATAKIGCEAIVRDFVADGGDAVILRPGIVYGPGGEQWAGRLGRMLRTGRLGDLGAAGDGFCNLVYNDDLAAAVVTLLDAPVAPGVAINMAPAAPPTWNEVLVAFGRAIGATPVRRIAGRRLRAEATMLAPPLEIARRVATRLKLRPGVLPEPIPPSLLALFRQRLVLDATRAHALLGTARASWDETLSACAGWFLEHQS